MTDEPLTYEQIRDLTYAVEAAAAGAIPGGDYVHMALRAVPKLLATIAARDQTLGNVLARIHRDGGHYITDHGWEKAVADADAAIIARDTEIHYIHEKLRAYHGIQELVDARDAVIKRLKADISADEANAWRAADAEREAHETTKAQVAQLQTELSKLKSLMWTDYIEAETYNEVAEEAAQLHHAVGHVLVCTRTSLCDDCSQLLKTAMEVKP